MTKQYNVTLAGIVLPMKVLNEGTKGCCHYQDINEDNVGECRYCSRKVDYNDYSLKVNFRRHLDRTQGHGGGN